MANDIFFVKGIKPAKLNVDGYRLRVLNALRKEGRFFRKEMAKTTSTWNNPPKFEFLIGLDRKEGASLLVGPVGTDLQVNKWKWLNEGTGIRWAVMSRDWRSKTAPNRLAAGPGAGQVVIAGRRAMQERNIRPRPGIAARNWTDLLTSRARTREFQRAIEKAIRSSAKDTF